MKHLFFKIQFIIGFFLLVSMNICGSDVITKQITVKLDKAGTLPSKIGSGKKYKITNLKIVGEINGTDVRFLREMAGCDGLYQQTNGVLAELDLSETEIVEGGFSYASLIMSNGRFEELETERNIIGHCFFQGRLA